MKARTMFMSLTERKRYQSGEIPGVLDQGQGCSGARAGRVTAGWTQRSRIFVEYRCHCVCASAGETQPAKLLAVFVVDTNEMELTISFGN